MSMLIHMLIFLLCLDSVSCDLSDGLYPQVEVFYIQIQHTGYLTELQTAAK